MDNLLPPLPPPLPKKNNNIDLSFVIPLLLLPVLIGIITFQTYKVIDYADRAFEYGDECTTLIEKADRALLYDNSNKPSNYGSVTGVYYRGEKYYCVYTEGRDAWAINMTDNHESCHDFVWKEPVHFCNSSCKNLQS